MRGRRCGRGTGNCGNSPGTSRLRFGVLSRPEGPCANRSARSAGAATMRFSDERVSLCDFCAETAAVRYHFLAISILDCILEANTVNKRRRSKTKGKKFPAEPLTRDEVKMLLKACSNRAPTGIRNRAL